MPATSTTRATARRAASRSSSTDPSSGGAIALHYTGTGASTIVAQGGAGTVDGSIVAGQTLSVNGTCGDNALETVDHSESNAGTVHLTSSGCGNNSQLSVASGDTFTNQAAGIVDIDGGAGGARTIAGNVTNKGTVNDNANATWTAGTWTNSGALNLATGVTLSVPNTAPSTFNNTTNGVVAATGTGLLNVAGGNTFDQGAGTTSGTEPVLLAGPASGTGVALHYTGIGASLLTTEGTGTVDGTMKTGQNLNILGFCGLNADEVIDKPMTSAGTIELTSTGCGNNATLAGKSAKGKDLLTMAKHGVLETLSGAGGARTIDDALTLHKGALDVNVNTTYTAEKKGIINSKGTVDIAASTTLTESSVTGSAFANTKGSITGTGELLVEPSDTFNEGAGTITGTNVLLNGAILEYTGATPGAGTIEAEGATSLAAGAPSAGQTLDVNGTCGLNANLTAAGSVTDLGALELTSTGCGNNSAITEPVGDALTIGSTGSLGLARRRWRRQVRDRQPGRQRDHRELGRERPERFGHPGHWFRRKVRAGSDDREHGFGHGHRWRHAQRDACPERHVHREPRLHDPERCLHGQLLSSQRVDGRGEPDQRHHDALVTTRGFQGPSRGPPRDRGGPGTPGTAPWCVVSVAGSVDGGSGRLWAMDSPRSKSTPPVPHRRPHRRAGTVLRRARRRSGQRAGPPRHGRSGHHGDRSRIRR